MLYSKDSGCEFLGLLPPWAWLPLSLTHKLSSILQWNLSIRRPTKWVYGWDALFGRMKEDDQKFVIPPMTMLIKTNRPAKERDLALHEDIFPFTCWNNGSQFAIDIFLVSKITDGHRSLVNTCRGRDSSKFFRWKTRCIEEGLVYADWETWEGFKMTQY